MKMSTAFMAFGILLSAMPALSSEKIKVLDRMMYTINPKASIQGPIFKDKASQNAKNDYISNMVRLVIKEADAKAKKYLEAGDTKAYYAFLTLALTVPMHEGLYVQFRNIDENVCNTNVNNGEFVRKTSEQNFNIFTQYFKKGPNAFIPDCEQMSEETSSTQIIRGGDGSDLSVMQVSMRWHADDFLANKKYESVQKSLQYGIGLLMKGFEPVYRNIDQYPCLFAKSARNGKKRFSYINLIRGIWAGKYNSGSIARTCRFSDPESPYKKHDAGFLANLKKIINFNETLDVDLIGNFTMNEAEKSAVKEIVSNLLNKTNDQVALQRVLKKK